MASQEVFVARGQRVRWACWAVAIAAVVIFSAVATALRGTTDGGGVFATGDQFAMVGLGFFVAAGALLFTRPRVVADEHTIAIRNVVTSVELPWSVVKTITFDDRSPWASIELHDDDQVAIMAVQAVDKQYAVAAVARLRELLAAAKH